MCPRRIRPPTPRTSRTVEMIGAVLAGRVREERRRKRLSMAVLAHRAGVSRPSIAALEGGARVSLGTWVAVAHALELELAVDLLDPRRRSAVRPRDEDPVHAAMGELEAQHLHGLGYSVAIDEPYQHFQFAGRADVAAWRLDPPALLHLENRTRFPNVGEMAGAWNAKRRWLGAELAKRLGVRGFQSETHVLVCLWSSEVLHALRLRPATFQALAPDDATSFTGWWTGEPPSRGRTSTLIVFDPFASARQRRWIDLPAALGTVRPRLRGYADAAERLAVLR